MKKEKNILIVWILALGLLTTGHTLAQTFDPALNGLIKQAIKNNHQIKINHYKIKQSQIDRQKAYQTFLPKLTLNASFTRLNDDIVLDPKLQHLLKGTEKLLIKEALGMPFNAQLPPAIPTSDIAPIQDKNIFRSSADLEWILFSGLEATYAIKATRHKDKALNYAEQIEQKKLIQNVVKTYDQLALILASEKVLQSAENQLNEQEKEVKSAVKNGLAIKIDLQRIDLARQNLNIKKADVQRQKQLIWAKLHQLTGKSTTLIQDLHPKLKPLLIQKTLIQQTSSSVEIKSLEEVVKAKSYQQKMAYSKYIPKIALKGHYEFIDDDLSLLDPKWYIGIGAKWQIFDGLKSYDEARKTKLDQAVYQEKIKETSDLLKLAETNAKLNYQLAQKQIIRHQKAVDLSKETYYLIDKQYQNGLVSITEVLDALTHWQTADFNLQKAYFKQRQAAIELLYRKDMLARLIQ